MYLFSRLELALKLVFLVALYLTGTVRIVWAQMPGTADPESVLTDILVGSGQGELTVTLPIRNIPVSPRISRLTEPDRLIFDFAGVLPKAGIAKMAVGSYSVKDVRTAIFGNDARGRPITRVVLDLDKPVQYQTRSEPGKFIIVVREGRVPPASAPKTVAKALAPPSPGLPKIPPPPVGANSTVMSANRLTNIDFGDSSVTLTFASGVAPRKSTLHDPERMVLDLPGVVAGLPSTKSIPDTLRSSVTGIRMAQFREDPPVYRIVFDQPRPNGSSQLSVEGNRVVVQFALRPAGAPTNAKAKPPVATTVPLARSPKSQSMVGSRAPNRVTKQKEIADGPKVDYANGLLRIEASNANLADVLYAVAEKTGAAIDMPFSDSMLDQVTFTMGPGKPRDVLATILEGSGFNYYIVENSSGDLEKIILIPKQ
jgi:hypothetical protein